MREDGMPGRNGVSGAIDPFAAKHRWFKLRRDAIAEASIN